MKRSVFFIVAALMLMLLVLVLIGFVISQDLGIGKTVVDKDGIVTINGNDYNVKSGSKLIVGSEGLGEGTSFIAAGNGGDYMLKGINIKLPENTEVLFKDNKVIIKLPENSQLDTLNLIDKGKATGTKFEFADGEKGFKLPSGDLFTGKTLTYEVDENGKGNFYFSDKDADLGGLKIRNPKEDKINLDFKGEISKEYAENYISLDTKNSKLVIGKNNPGAGIEVEKIGKKVIYQAGKDADARDKAGAGTIVINDKEKTIVQTYGDFKIYNGGIGLRTGINSNGEKTILAPPNLDKSKESIPMEIINYDSEGKVLGKEPKKIIINDKNELSTSVLRDVSNLDSETGQVTRITFGNPGIGPEVRSGVSQRQTDSSQSQTDSNKLKIQTFGNTGPYTSALQDIKEHQGQIPFTSDDDLGHETTHGINAYLREKNGGTGNVNAFYLLNGNYVVLKEPDVRMSDITDYIPSQLRGTSSYNLYMIQQQSSWNNEPLYIFDELTSYTNGAIVSSQINERGSSNVPEFMAYSLALGKTIEQRDPNYWNSPNGEQFKQFLGYSLQRAINAETSQSNGNREAVIQKFNGMTNQDLQDFARKTYGADWTRTNLGF